MKKPYLVRVNGLLWARKLTKAGAEKLIKWLREEKGLNAVLAYDIEGNKGAAFTDDDSKKLKEHLKKHTVFINEDYVSIPFKMSALLARLEAAEQCVEKASLCPSLEWDRYYEAWRESAGKAGENDLV